MAEHKPDRAADAIEQAPGDDDLDLNDVEGDVEISVEVAEADAVEQGRSRAGLAAVAARPLPTEANEADAIEQRLSAADEGDDDEFR